MALLWLLGEWVSGGSYLSAKITLSIFKRKLFEISTDSAKLESAPPPHLAKLESAPPPHLAKLENAPPPHLAKIESAPTPHLATLKSAPPPQLTVLKTAQVHLNPQSRGS